MLGEGAARKRGYGEAGIAMVDAGTRRLREVARLPRYSAPTVAPEPPPPALGEGAGGEGPLRALACGFLLLVLAACRPGPTPPPAPTAPPAVVPLALATPVAAPADLPVGVQFFESDVDTDAVDQVRAAGATWARGRALWKAIEPVRRSPPRYEWAMTDKLLGTTTAAGFRNVAAVYANPPWVTEWECAPVPPVDLERYGRFWQALVERYDGDGVDDAPNGAVARHWQVSNEADLDPTAPGGEADYGGCAGNDPAAYAEMVVTAYRAAKAADPRAQVGFGPVAYDRFTAASAPAGWTAEPGPFVYDFTQRAIEHLYAAHAGDPALPFFDFVSLHNYNDNGHFWDGDNPPLQQELVGKVAHFRAEQLTVPGLFDLRDRPVLISETGLASSPADEWTDRSEALQAVYAGQTLVRALAVQPLAAIWYTARDNIVGDCLPPHYDWLTFGLMRSDYFKDQLEARCPIHPWLASYPLARPADPKPAVTAFATVTGALAGTTFERQLTPAETGSPAVEAYRFRAADGSTVLAAWTTTGERLGKVGTAPITATLRLGPALVAPWTGRLAVTDHLGARRAIAAGRDDGVAIEVGQAPVYVRSGE
jgi:hypothetical protein